MNNLALLLSADTKASKVYSDDVFSSFVYTGNGSTQTINNGIDLAGKGGLVWIKRRDAGTNGNHSLYHTSRNINTRLLTDATNGNVVNIGSLTAFNSNGFSLDNYVDTNNNSSSIISWSFLNARNFYHHTVVTKTAGNNASFTFSTIATLGMVRVKRTDAAGSWYIWHRSLSAGQLMIGETTAAAATLGHITVSGNTVTLVNGVIADGTYLVEAFGHDTGVDGIVQCGSFTTDGSGNATVNLGWEPQYVLLKNSTGLADSWNIYDTSRGLVADKTSQSNKTLVANTSVAEGPNGVIGINATGCNFGSLQTTQTYIYLAIRRPNKPPTLGTQVYNAIARTGTGAAATVTGVGFAPDLCNTYRLNGTGVGIIHIDKLRGTSVVLGASSVYGNESSASQYLNADDFRFTMGGTLLGSGGIGGYFNFTTYPYINYFFKRASGVLDQICYTGTGTNKTEFHNLTVQPELWLIKSRSAATQWVWGSTLLSNTEKINMPTVTGRITDATVWNSASPTSTTISLGTSTDINASAATYVAYLWASKAGISKVFSYAGNGTSQSVNCGFTTGARYIMIIRTDAGVTQDIFVFDSVRGIISANDPHLSMNTAAAEVTTDDSVDPDVTGFIINQVAATNINVLGAIYIGLAYA